MLKLDTKEQQLVEELKAKYSSIVESRAQDPSNEELKYAIQPCSTSSSVPGGAAGKQSDVDVKLCQCCNGTGLTVEEYNHRRLEKFCTSCEGKGVNMYRNGVEVLEATSSSQSAKPTWAQDTKERKAKLEASIASLTEKIESYQKEKSQLASGAGQDAEKAKLQQELEVQLDSQIQRLTKGRDEMTRSLQHYLPAVAEAAADS